MMNNNTVKQCQDCGQKFVFTADEKRYYQTKGWLEPTRCPICQGAYTAARKDRFRGKIASSRTE